MENFRWKISGGTPLVIKVFRCIKTAWNRVKMFATVLTTITTIWRHLRGGGGGQNEPSEVFLE